MRSEPGAERRPPRDATPARVPSRLAAAVVPALLVATIAAVYGQVRTFAFVNYDDQVYVTANPWVLRGIGRDGLAWAFGAFHVSNWHPITWLSHMTDVTLFGADAGAHHLVNVAFHALNAVLLFAFLLRATGAVRRSALVAILFAVHPLHVESVAWVSERKDVLSGFFFFLTLHAWLAYVRRPTASRYLLVAASFVAGVLAKPMLVTVPFVLLLVDVWPLGRLRTVGAGAGAGPLAGLAALAREKLPLFGISAASCVVTWLAQKAGESVMVVDAVPLGGRLANAVVSYALYLARTVWPSGLAVFYPHPVLVSGGIPAWKAAGAAALLVAITVAVMRERARRPYLACGWFWYLGMLVPVIGIAQVGAQGLADRYTYLPLVGIFVAVAWLGAERVARLRVPEKAVWTATGIVVLLLSIAAHRQVGTWRDSLSLNARALAVTERNWVAWNGSGDALADAGRFDEAMRAYREAIEIQPLIAEPWNGLGTVYGSLGAHREAIGYFERAVRLRPQYAMAWSNLGVARVLARDPRGAAESLAALERLDPARERELRAFVDSASR